MRLRIAVTDNAWFRYLQSQPDVDEVNFWQPGGERAFRALEPGELLLFKLHHPQNYIVGGGFFVRFLSFPWSFAWAELQPREVPGTPPGCTFFGRLGNCTPEASGFLAVDARAASVLP